MYASKLEKSTAEVGRSRKEREGLSKCDLLRHECPYTSLEFGLGENPVWRMQGSGSWISLLCINLGSSGACTGCGCEVGCSSLTGTTLTRAGGMSLAPEALTSVLEHRAGSRQGGEDLLSHETSHQRQRSKLWLVEWVISAQAVQIRYGSQEILFGHVGGRKCGTVVWGKNTVLARRAVLWSKTWGQRKLRIWRFGQGVWKTSAAIHHTAPANTMCRSGLPLAAVLLCQCFFLTCCSNNWVFPSMSL